MKMQSMIEKVARAIAEVNVSGSDLLHYSYDKDSDGYLELARAAIEAMREPTEAMLDSTGGECRVWAPGAWVSMIDAALKENGERTA
jgi:hypothetical protein